MAEHFSLDESDIADDLLDLIPRLLREIRADIPREAGSEQVVPELRDISELRATTGQIRLLRIVIIHQRCTMQELADQLDVAPPTVTAMVKRLLSQGFVERLRDEQDWLLNAGSAR
jgi:MarR family transcriptional regulator, organic hydroperoxide resistance regulator